MNLKEAFRFQNKLQLLMDEAQAILNNPGNVTRTEKTYLRKKVMPEAENETVVVEQDSPYAGRITEVAGFLLWILAQREALSAAIRHTKNTLPIAGQAAGRKSGKNKSEQQAAACCSFFTICSFGADATRISSMGTSSSTLRAYRLSMQGRLAPRCHL